MQDDFLRFFQSELQFLAKEGARFAQKYPVEAGRLRIDEGLRGDPHVERLIQSFAFLIAAQRKRLADSLPDVYQAVLRTLYPQYLAPLPSLSIVEFRLDTSIDKNELSSAAANFIPAGTPLRMRSVGGGTRCRFRTAYPVKLWPITIDGVELCAPPFSGVAQKASLRITLKAKPLPFAALPLSSLRFYLCGEPQHEVYRLLFGHLSRIELRADAGAQNLPIASVKQVGFAADERLFPGPLLAGQAMLREYFALPEKFLFFDVELPPSGPQCTADETLELWFHFAQPPTPLPTLTASHIRLGCTPIVNLFSGHAEAIELDPGRDEYYLRPSTNYGSEAEIYAVERVCALRGGAPSVTVPELYAHDEAAETSAKLAWHVRRTDAPVEEDAAVTAREAFYLILISVDGVTNPCRFESLLADLLCTNGDYPSLAPILEEVDPRDGSSYFEPEKLLFVREIRCLLKPTASHRSSTHKLEWRLIAQLSLNYLSLCREGIGALRELLRLHDLPRTSANQAQLDGLEGVRYRSAVRRIELPREVGGPRSITCPGIEVEIKLAESHGDVRRQFLFTAVLERFFGLYVSINSFSQTTVVRAGRVIVQWPCRAGSLTL